METEKDAVQGIETGEERLESLKSVYSFLEIRYKEQIDALKQVESSVKSRLAILTAVLGAVAFITSSLWRLPQVSNSPENILYLTLSIIPLFIIFIRVYFLATKSLEQQYATPGFVFEEYIKLSQHPDPCLESVYEDFVKLLSIAIQKNTTLFEKTSDFILAFRRWSRYAVIASILPITLIIIIYKLQ